MKGTVAIIGSHPRTRKEFDFNRTDCDIWVFNEAVSNKTLPRADAVFQMHEEAIWRNPGNRNDPHHLEWLNTQKDCVVYMQDEYKDVNKSVRFPLEEITDRFHISYFTSSVSYALALACFQGYKRLELYGVEMETNTEYKYQRDGVTLWLGVALGLGIEVDAHIGMFDQPLYGYEGEVVMPYERFGERIAELQPQVDELSKQYRAALIDFNKAIEIFANSSGKKEENTLYAEADRMRKLGQELGKVDGRIQENKKYQAKADKMKESAGEFLFSRQEFESAAKHLSEEAKKMDVSFISLGTTLEHVHRAIRSAAKGSPKRSKLVQTYKQQAQTYLQQNNMAAVLQGAAQENFEFMSYMDKHIRAAGGSKSEAVLLERMKADANMA